MPHSERAFCEGWVLGSLALCAAPAAGILGFSQTKKTKHRHSERSPRSEESSRSIRPTGKKTYPTPLRDLRALPSAPSAFLGFPAFVAPRLRPASRFPHKKKQTPVIPIQDPRSEESPSIDPPHAKKKTHPTSLRALRAPPSARLCVSLLSPPHLFPSFPFPPSKTPPPFCISPTPKVKYPRRHTHSQPESAHHKILREHTL